MAKRKRLTPARLPDAPQVDVAASEGTVTDESGALETKTMFPRYPNGVYKSPKRPPIADVAHDAAASAALSEVVQTLTEARNEGRLIQRLPLDAIDADYLVRDRMAVDADEMTTLMESLQQRGQQTAIEVSALDDGRYGLISGWRRLSALRKISVDKGGLDTILAIIRTPEDAASAYLAMVEENEVRVGLSYYERARIVVRATDRGVYRADRIALSALFQSASRPKRSKIGSFVRIVRALDAHLSFPTTMTERSGLALVQALDADPQAEARVIAALTPAATTAAAEAAAIASALQPTVTIPTPDKPAVNAPDVLANGLRVTTGSQGQITLQGALLRDAGFREKLLTWLTENS